MVTELLPGAGLIGRAAGYRQCPKLKRWSGLGALWRRKQTSARWLNIRGVKNSFPGLLDRPQITDHRNGALCGCAMKSVMQDIQSELRRFIDSRTESLLVVSCEPDHSGLLLKSLESLAEREAE
jgi:hypothetical protein